MFSLQRWFLFPSHLTQPEHQAGAAIDGLERLWVESPEGPVEAWFLPGRDVSADRPGPTVIFAHGNAELIEQWPPMLAPYRALGVSVVLPEYRGYGRSAGKPSEGAIAADLATLYDQVAARADVDRDRIVFHGRSLGGGAVCALAARREPAALVLESTFTSVADMAGRYLIPRFLVRDPFDSRAVVARLDVPVLIMHGRRDELIPFAHSLRLAEAARRPTHVEFDCGHNDLPPDSTVYWGAVVTFLGQAGILDQVSP